MQGRNDIRSFYTSAFIKREDVVPEQNGLAQPVTYSPIRPPKRSAACSSHRLHRNNTIRVVDAVPGRRSQERQHGETLYRIVTSFGISVRVLRALNQLREWGVIYPGQMLYVK